MGVFNIPLWSVVLIAVFSVFCICACGVFTMLSAKKAGNTQNRQHKTTDIPNPTAGAHPELGVITVSAQPVPTWEAHQDDATGQTYYFNKSTGETSWTPPASVQPLKL